MHNKKLTYNYPLHWYIPFGIISYNTIKYIFNLFLVKFQKYFFDNSKRNETVLQNS